MEHTILAGRVILNEVDTEATEASMRNTHPLQPLDVMNIKPASLVDVLTCRSALLEMSRSGHISRHPHTMCYALLPSEPRLKAPPDGSMQVSEAMYDDLPSSEESTWFLIVGI